MQETKGSPTSPYLARWDRNTRPTAVRNRRAPAVLTALAACLPFVLFSGCWLLPTTRHLPRPKAPLVTLSVEPQDLVARLEQRWNELNSLQAKVDIKARITKEQKTEIKENNLPSTPGYILLRKPAGLHVWGTYLAVKAFDMASDGLTFKLWIPIKNLVLRGSNDAVADEKETLLNLRPKFFVDALMIRGLDPDDDYSVFSNTITVEDPGRKHIFLVPEYILNIQRRRPGSRQLDMIRVIHFQRDNLLPSQQDIYNTQGNVETEVFYSKYREFESSSFPTSIVIKRPLEGIEIALTVHDVHPNKAVTDAQLTFEVPADAQVRELK